MTLVKAQNTRRKFYNKWLYKISIKNRYAYDFKENLSNFTTRKSLSLTDNLKKLALVLLLEPKDSWAIRTESSILDIYTNNKDLYNNIGNQFSNIVFRRFEPNPADIDILNKNRHVAVKKLPYNRYKYKVYLRPYELKENKDIKEKIMDWLQNNSPQIKCTDKTRDWFMNTLWNYDRRYVLVENEQQLLLLQMRLGSVMGSVYHYILTDK